VVIARRELETADEALRLAEARMEAGAATRLDVAQAEVERGRAEVALLQAQAAEETEKLRLLQRLGTRSASTTSSSRRRWRSSSRRWALDELTRLALQRAPAADVAARASESASRSAARAARMQYLPSSASAGGWSRRHAHGHTR
jgi:outer membrane protein TolC